MIPVLIDLSQWKPFGIALDSVMAKTIAFLVLAAIGYVFGSLLSRRRAMAGNRWLDALNILYVLGLCVVAFGLVWVVGKVHSYGMMMALGFLVAMCVGRWKIARCGEDPEMISNLGILALVAGVVGARIAYVIEFHEKFGPIAPDGTQRTLVEQIAEMFKLTSGGLVFDGGLVLAIVCTLAYLFLKRMPVRRFMDVLAIIAVLGLAFGRTGCFLNGCCYGQVCSEDFAAGVHFPYSGLPLVYPHDKANPFPPGAVPSPVYAQQFARNENPDVPAELVRPVNGGAILISPDDLTTPEQFDAGVHAHSVAVHPTQAYAIVNALVLAGLLFAFSRLRTREGQVFAMLLIFYPLTRFILEIIRDDNPDMAITPAQVKCMILVAVGIALMGVLRKLPASCGPTLADRLAVAEAAKTAEAHAPKRKRRKKR